MRSLDQRKGSADVKSRCENATAQAYMSFWIKKKLQWKNYNEPVTNYEEHAGNLETLMRI